MGLNECFGTGAEEVVEVESEKVRVAGGLVLFDGIHGCAVFDIGMSSVVHDEIARELVEYITHDCFDFCARGVNGAESSAVFRNLISLVVAFHAAFEELRYAMVLEKPVQSLVGLDVFWDGLGFDTFEEASSGGSVVEHCIEGADRFGGVLNGGIDIVVVHNIHSKEIILCRWPSSGWWTGASKVF